MSLLGAFVAETFVKFLRTKTFLYITAGILTFGLYKWNQWTIESLQQENDKLKQDKIVLEQAIDEYHKNHEKIRKSLDAALAERRKSVLELEETKKTLHREIRKRKSLEELAIKKPKLVEKRINDGSKKVIKCFENLSRGLPCEK